MGAEPRVECSFVSFCPQLWSLLLPARSLDPFSGNGTEVVREALGQLLLCTGGW